MFRNCLAAALRNLARNRTHATINIIGLAVGFTAAIFAALFVRNELTYEHWIPDYRDIYEVATTVAHTQGGVPQESLLGYRDTADWLALDFPHAITARLTVQGPLMMRRGNVKGMEGAISRASENIFSVLKFPAIAGVPAHALEEPDAIVLTRSLAQKYFGYDAPIGKTIEVNRRPMRVTAVLENWPANTGFTSTAFISERAPIATAPNLSTTAMAETFVRLSAGAATALERELPNFVDRHVPGDQRDGTKMRLIPLANIHLAAIDSDHFRRERARHIAAITGVTAVGLLILLAAVINFVNISTARASQRGVEIGVRKVTGAMRRQLVIQFVGESLITAALAFATAIVLTLVLFPAFQAMTGTPIHLSPTSDPAFAAGLVAAAALAGVLAGFYPAFILSSLRPATVLKSGIFRADGSSLLRRVLVVLQFSILVALTSGTLIIHRQTDFALNESLSFKKDQLLLIARACTGAMRDQVAKLPGVRAVACAPAIGDDYVSTVVADNGVKLDGWYGDGFSPVDFGYFDTLGLKPVAGRFFSPSHGEDTAAANAATNPTVVISETAVRALGFASPDAAVGQTIRWRRKPASGGAVKTMPLLPSRIIGVVADVSMWIKDPTHAQFYYYDPLLLASPSTWLYVKLTGETVPETLQAIDQLWARLGDPDLPILRRFADQELQLRYNDVARQARVMAVFAAVSVFIASLGLYALAAFAAERRTKEIGIRKTVGASTAHILALLLWNFAKPVLWANLIAWPIAYWGARRWLESFARHIALEPVVFLTASCLALLIAILAVASQVITVARAQPVTALRYE